MKSFINFGKRLCKFTELKMAIQSKKSIVLFSWFCQSTNLPITDSLHFLPFFVKWLYKIPMQEKHSVYRSECLQIHLWHNAVLNKLLNILQGMQWAVKWNTRSFFQTSTPVTAPLRMPCWYVLTENFWFYIIPFQEHGEVLYFESFVPYQQAEAGREKPPALKNVW